MSLHWVGDKTPRKDDPARMSVDKTDAQVKKLYGPGGEVLRTFSDRPPTGFHQGERGEPRR